MAEKLKILYIAPKKGSFIRTEVAQLRQLFEVVEFRYQFREPPFNLPTVLLRQFFFLLWHLRSADRVVVSFGGFAAVLPTWMSKLARVPIYVIVHGTDCAAIPAIGYGMLRKGPLRSVCHIAYRNATRMLPVSQALVANEGGYGIAGTQDRQGFQVHFPDLETPYTVVPNGIDPQAWEMGKEKEPLSFLSVFGASQFILKGGDLVVEVARRMPQARFYIVGMQPPPHLESVPDNLTFLGYLPQEELKQWYLKSQVLLHLSLWEGFGLAVCEAMACGCVPVVSRMNALPHIAGESGFVLQAHTADALEKLLTETVIPDGLILQRSQLARERVLTHFTLQQRREGLGKAISLGS